MSAGFLEVTKASSGDDAGEKFLVSLEHVTTIKPADCGSVVTLTNGVSLAIADSYENVMNRLDVLVWKAQQSRPRAVA